ncbi:hypothetical protein ACP6OW_003450 [Cronobacter turicensis]
MMKYNINITNCYHKLICLDNNIGLNSYFSILDLVSKKERATILLNNIVVNMHDESWYGAIAGNNNNSIVTRVLNDLSVNDLDIFTLMLQRAELVVSGIKCVYIKLSTSTGDYYHSTGNEFCIGDKQIWLAGSCSDYGNSVIDIILIFDGEIDLSFYESDVVIESINYDNFINPLDVDNFNKAYDSFISLKRIKIEDLGFNNIKSGLLGFYENVKYFDHGETGDIAIKHYKF